MNKQIHFRLKIRNPSSIFINSNTIDRGLFIKLCLKKFDLNCGYIIKYKMKVSNQDWQSADTVLLT